MFFLLNKSITKYFRNTKERRKMTMHAVFLTGNTFDKCKFKTNLVNDCSAKYSGICYKCIVDICRYIKHVFFLNSNILYLNIP